MPRETILKALAPLIVVAAVVIALCGACSTSRSPQSTRKSSPAEATSGANAPSTAQAPPPAKGAPPPKPLASSESGVRHQTRPARLKPLQPVTAAPAGQQPMKPIAAEGVQRSPASVPPAATDVDLNAVDQALAQLPIGTIAYNAPATMFKGESHPVSVILSPAATADQLEQQLHTLLGRQENVETAQIQISQRMRATLTGEGFDISPKGPQIQAVSALQPTEWDWTVSPARDGDLTLQLVLEAILVLDGGQSAPRRIRTFIKTIQVRVQTAEVVEGFIGGNWQWLWSTLLVPLAGYFWHRRRRARRDRSRAGPRAQ